MTIYEMAKKYIPNCAQTLSKRPETYVNGVYPKFLQSGLGCQVFDDKGKPYVDYISSLGAILLGYRQLPIDDAVISTINTGEVLLSLPHEKEAILASKLVDMLPHSGKVKFFKTGSEATSAAVRVARARTGNNVILKCGYNGWHDWAMVHSDRNSGIPLGLGAYTERFTYNNIKSLELAFRISNSVAAVILEPVVYDEPRDNFLQEVIDLAHKNGALVIFDEIVTGLRFGLSGAGGLFNVVPDLVCLGKSLGNGYPIAALIGGKHMDIFEYEEFIASGTFSGDLIGISAAIAVLENFKSSEIWTNGIALKHGFNDMVRELGLEGIQCVGYAPRTKFDFPTPEHRALFWQECVKRGILFGHTNFVTMSHKPLIIASTLNICRDALKIVKDNWKDPKSKLEGEMPKEVLR